MVQLIIDVECSKCGAINQREEKWENGNIIHRCKSCHHSVIAGTYTTTATEGGWITIAPEKTPSKITF